MPIRIRNAIKEDIPFVFNAWLKSYRDSFFARNITTTVYFNEHHKVLENLLSSCETLIACNNQDPSDIYGFICGERVDGIFVLHYIYVKHTYRFLGLARMLVTQLDPKFGESACLYTHNGKIAERLAAKYNLIYSPYVALIPNYRKVYTNPEQELNKKQENKNEDK